MQIDSPLEEFNGGFANFSGFSGYYLRLPRIHSDLDCWLQRLQSRVRESVPVERIEFDRENRNFPRVSSTS